MPEFEPLEVAGAVPIADDEVAGLLEAPLLQDMMNHFYQLTRIGIGIIDLNGRILVSTGWQEIYSRFHHVPRADAAYDADRDRHPSVDARPGHHLLYKGHNGLWNQATPIVAGGRHIANLVLGQFLFADETADLEAFAGQAEAYGFDREQYLAALARVPRWSRDTVANAMAFYTRLATLIARLSYANLRQRKALAAHRNAEGALRESEAKYHSIVDNIAVGIFRSTPDGRLLDANPAFARMFGLESVAAALHALDDMGRQLWCDADERRRVVSRSLVEARVENVEVRLKRLTGESFHGLVSFRGVRGDDGELRFLEGRVEDISEIVGVRELLRRHEEELSAEVRARTTELQRRNAELTEINVRLAETRHQLLQSEKLAAIGQLAAGVAHEINNPIGYINANLGELRRQASDLLALVGAYQSADDLIATRPQLAAAIENAARAADLDYLRTEMLPLIDESIEGTTCVRRIVQDLKDFSRIEAGGRAFADLECGLDSTLNIVMHEIKYKATVVREYAGIPEIECVGPQLNQVFMNLLVNAAQAIDDRGTITIRTGFDAGHVWIEIADTGKGIPAELRHRIFEPFFTTKPVGKGTGLGLSLAWGIVQRHDGEITVDSTPGIGTTFRVTIPRQRTENSVIGKKCQASQP